MLLGQQELMKDPEYRKARLAQTRMNMAQSYPGLAEALELTPEESNRLFDLLAESQMETSDVSLLTFMGSGGQPDAAAMAESSRRMQEMNRKRDAALQSLLGASGFQRWQDYQQTRAPRQQVVQLGRALEGMGATLSTEQARFLTDTFIAEQKRQQAEAQRSFGAGRTPDPEERARMLEERFQLQAESNQRIVDAAKAHLDSRQLQAMQASLEQQLLISRATSRRALEQAGAAGQSSPGANLIFALPPAAATP
jgi:hypothetical protein